MHRQTNRQLESNQALTNPFYGKTGSIARIPDVVPDFGWVKHLGVLFYRLQDFPYSFSVTLVHLLPNIKMDNEIKLTPCIKCLVFLTILLH